MSGMDNYSLLTTKFGQLAPLLIGEKSLFTPRFWDRTNIHVVTEDQVYQPRNSSDVSLGGTVRFVLPKRATLIGPLLLQTPLAPAVPNAAPPGGRGAYVNNLGDQIIRQVTIRYGSHHLQSYFGEAAQICRRVAYNEIQEECRDELTLGNRRQADLVQETERADFFDNGGIIYSPLDQLFFTEHFDEYWMPEALATEAEIIIDYQRAGRIAYTTQAAVPATAPQIDTTVGPTLRVRETTLTAPEKAERLNYFNADKGMLFHILDWETQLEVPFTSTGAANQTLRVNLDNLRLDLNEMFFLVRRAGPGVVAPGVSMDLDWSIDPLDSATNDGSQLVEAAFGNLDRAGIVNIDSFRLEANGSRLTNDIPSFINRTWQRKLYHEGATSRDFIFFVSPSLMPDNRKHVTGFLNTANLGKFELIINHSLPPRDFVIDVYAQSHNVIQMRRGDAVKSLK